MKTGGFPRALFALTLILSLIFALPLARAEAKTLVSAKAENVFFYASDAQGKAVLLAVLPMADLKKLAHGRLSDLTGGRDTGENYCISSTDNYPTTQYCEARGFTVPELLDYVKSVTPVPGTADLRFTGEDAVYLMATDSYGAYNRSWTHDRLYGAARYYFEGLLNPVSGWNTGWEIAGEENAKFGVTLDEYETKYRATDPYYAAKRAVFATGVRTVPILAVESFSGRTTTATLVASTEIGIADYIAANGGTAAGSLKDVLADDWSLRLSLPMTEADLMAAHRTAYDNFKWIYNLRLSMERPPASFRSQGSVAEPAASVSVAGDVLTLRMDCASPRARIYYSFDGAPQTPYEGPVDVDVKGRDLAADPLTFYMTAVREGFDDAGVITAKYPGLSPAFRTLYSGMAGQDLTFAAQESVSAADFAAWTDSIGFVTMKNPESGAYIRLDSEKYRVDRTARSIRFDGSLFRETGSYSFVFHAAGYADKAVSLAVKRAAPEIRAPEAAAVGQDLTFTFDDPDYQDGLSLYIAPAGGEPVMVPSNHLDRGTAGRVTLKASWFALPGCPVTSAGRYDFRFTNNRYEPGSVSVTPDLAAGSPPPVFSDTDFTKWYGDAVRYAAAAGLFDPLEGNRFGPDEPVTRAVFILALYRRAAADEFAADGSARADAARAESGEPSAGAESGGSGAATVAARTESGEPSAGAEAPRFIDVPEGTELSEAVAWAVRAGIVNGVDKERFAPDNPITREQIAAVLWRYAAQTAQGALVSAPRGDLQAFSDASRVAPWAEEPLALAVGAGLINGMGDGTLAPKSGAARAQAAQLLWKYDQAASERPAP